MDDQKKDHHDLPRVAVDFIDSVIKNVRYRRKVRQEVRDELIDHFTMDLSECNTPKDKEDAVKEMIEEFGNVKTLSCLIRRGKKRCRPLWKKVIIRTGQVLCILVLFVVARAMYFEIGSPNISVDYSQWLNDLVQQGRDEELNAREYYEKAIELSVDVPESLEGILDDKASIDEVDSDELKKYLDEMKPAFEALRQGAQKPYYWPKYSVKLRTIKAAQFSSQIVESQMEFLGNSKRLARKLQLFQIPWETHNGNVKEALKDCNVLRRFGGHCSGRGILIEQLVGISVEAMAIATIETILYEQDVNAEILKWLQNELEKDYGGNTFVVDIEAEKAFWLDWIQRGFTDDGNGNGRVLREGLPLVVADEMSGLSGFLFGTYPDRRQFTESIESLFDGFDKKYDTAPWQVQRDEEEIFESLDFSSTSVLLGISFRGFYKVKQIGWRYVCERNALVAICAVLRCKQEKGHVPASLEELVEAGFLSEMPFDPFSGNSLIYRPEGDSFILYSFGPDLKDNGGVIGSTKSGKSRKWHKTNGDAVFWPVR